MRRILCLLLIASYTFALGIVATPLWRQVSRPAPKVEVSVELPQKDRHDASSDLPILEYCELANNPVKYSGQIVRVRARLSGFIHGLLFSDSTCAGIDTQTAVFFDPGYSDEIKRELNEARGSNDWRLPVDIVAVGMFWKVNPSYDSDTIYDTASLRFELFRIEEASKVR